MWRPRPRVEARIAADSARRMTEVCTICNFGFLGPSSGYARSGRAGRIQPPDGDCWRKIVSHIVQSPNGLERTTSFPFDGGTLKERKMNGRASPKGSSGPQPGP